MQTSYMRRAGQMGAGGKRKDYYYCNRSGVYRGDPSKRKGPDSSGKAECNCTASIELIITAGQNSVSATFWIDHYGFPVSLGRAPSPPFDSHSRSVGHALDFKHLRLPRKEKDLICASLQLGYQPAPLSHEL